MKKFLTTITVLTFLTTSAFANCDQAYRRASKIRDARNRALVLTTAFAVGGVGIAVPLASVQALSLVGYQLILVGGTAVTMQAHNNFDDIRYAISAAHRNETHPSLSKLAKKVARESKIKYSKELENEIAQLLVEADQTETFCPVVKMKRNGDEKRAVFNNLAVTKYLSDALTNQEN